MNFQHFKRTLILGSLLGSMGMGTRLMAATGSIKERAQKLLTTLTGEVQNQSSENLLNLAEQVYFGQPLSGGKESRLKLIEKALYESAEGPVPSLKARLEFGEWQTFKKVQSEQFLKERVENLESQLGIKNQEGPLAFRMEFLSQFLENPMNFKKVQVQNEQAIRVSLVEDLSSKNARAGQNFNFKLEQDIVVDGMIVAPRGALGVGVVTNSRGAKRFGINGELSLKFNNLKDFSHGTIALSEKIELSEKNRLASAVTASLVGFLALGPIGGVGGLFIEGKEVQLPKGTEWNLKISSGQSLSGFVYPL